MVEGLNYGLQWIGGLLWGKMGPLACHVCFGMRLSSTCRQCVSYWNPPSYFAMVPCVGLWPCATIAFQSVHVLPRACM